MVKSGVRTRYRPGADWNRTRKSGSAGGGVALVMAVGDRLCPAGGPGGAGGRAVSYLLARPAGRQARPRRPPGVPPSVRPQWLCRDGPPLALEEKGVAMCKYIGSAVAVLLLAGAAAPADAAEKWADADLPTTAGLALWLDAGRQDAAWKAHNKLLSPAAPLDVCYDGSGRRL